MDAERLVVSVDGAEVEVARDATLLEACRAAGVMVPTLCHLPGLEPESSCGVCVVEVIGARNLERACSTRVAEGMRVVTKSRRVLEARRTAVELILANHPTDCLSCSRSDACRLRSLASLVGTRAGRFPRTRPASGRVDRGPSMVFDRDRCVLCGCCVTVCRDLQSVSALDFAGRGLDYRVAAFMDGDLAGSSCVECGQCTLVCPTGALSELDQTAGAWAMLREPDAFPFVMAAPGFSAALGEALGLPDGALSVGSMVAALKRLGFTRVFDTGFAADVVLVEERAELDARRAAGDDRPLLSSCSPAWVRFARTFAPGVLPLLSTCKSPQQVMGALVKTWYAECHGIDPARIRLVSAVPCVAKKSEALEPGGASAAAWWTSARGAAPAAWRDVDLALTTRELAAMIRSAGLRPERLPAEAFDEPFSSGSRAGLLIGTSGGLAGAFPGASGSPRIAPVRTTAVHGLAAARTLLDAMASGPVPYDFIEVMACPGGCAAGGGQPPPEDMDAASSRSARLIASASGIERTGPAPGGVGMDVYDGFIGAPLSATALALLHRPGV